jgi:hypothetical protein
LKVASFCSVTPAATEIRVVIVELPPKAHVGAALRVSLIHR